MKILILVGHGSRVVSANQEIQDLAEGLAQRVTNIYADVFPAFLELAEPSIPSAIQKCIDKGADEVVLLPYFLARGRHVETDIPEEIHKKQEQYPHIKMELLDYFGKSKYISDILVKQITIDH